MLTDVNDTSITENLQIIDQATKNDNIHTTIVGISD